MSKRIKLSVFLISVILIGFFVGIGNNSLTSANPLSVMEEAAGGIIPGNDTFMQLVEANVVMEIDESFGENGSFAISFDGNYTIFNPNETTSMLIGAPFLTTYEGLTESLEIEVEGIEVDYYILYYEYSNSSGNPWMIYFGLHIVYERYFAICNVTFEGHSNTTIRYSFDSIANVGNYDVLCVLYDVETARGWHNVTTENVEFRVKGQQPDYYYNNTNAGVTSITITDIENGKSYLWTWEEKIIWDSWVYVEYMYYTPATTPTPGYLFVSTLFSLIIINKYQKIKKKHKM
ncbi:MAG: hypothetical protein ACTSSN_02885 [Candidatus Heimdallarchaeaceae archaeon]